MCWNAQLRFRLLFFSLLACATISASAEDAADQATRQTAPPKAGFLSKHVQFLGTEGVTRFLYIDQAPGKVTSRDLQYRISTRVQLNLVGEGKTYVQARGESGPNFILSYTNTGAGLNKGLWQFNLKSLFMGQKIGRHLEAQAGGIEYDWGSGSEATYADNDAWLEGYRLRYTGSGRHWTPDRISATVGYVGDYLQPNAFARLYRMGDENYIQILATKKPVKNLDVSAEFDSLQSIRYSREAAHSQKLPFFVIDEISVETLIRASDNPSFGWSSSLFRTLDHKGRVRAGMFYSAMPRVIFLNGTTQVLQNGDSYGLGKRVGPTLRVAPCKGFDVMLFGSDRLDNTPGPRYRGQVTLRYQLAGLLNRALRQAPW